MYVGGVGLRMKKPPALESLSENASIFYMWDTSTLIILSRETFCV